MIYAHIVLSSPPDITDDPHREISEFIKHLSRKSSWMKKIFSIPYILKAHMFCITLESAHTSLSTHKLTAKSIYCGKCISAMENVYLLWKMYIYYGKHRRSALQRILKFGFTLK